MATTPRLSKTTFISKCKDTVHKFWQRYENRTDITRVLNLYPDNNGYLQCIIYYNN